MHRSIGQLAEFLMRNCYFQVATEAATIPTDAFPHRKRASIWMQTDGR